MKAKEETYDDAGETISNKGAYMPWPRANCSGVSPLLFGFLATSTKSSRNNSRSKVDLQWLRWEAKWRGVCSEKKLKT